MDGDCHAQTPLAPGPADAPLPLLGPLPTAGGQADPRAPPPGPFGSELWGFVKYSIALRPVLRNERFVFNHNLLVLALVFEV